MYLKSCEENIQLASLSDANDTITVHHAQNKAPWAIQYHSRDEMVTITEVCDDPMIIVYDWSGCDVFIKDHTGEVITTGFVRRIDRLNSALRGRDLL